MMPERPLSYESLKTVLQFMDANVRFQISRCMPSIKIVEKKVPLKINDLRFEHMKTIINGTTYQVCVTRQYPASIPNPVDNGREFSYDVDPYGFDTSFIELTEGDVDLRVGRRAGQDNDGDEINLMQQYKVVKNRLEEIENEMLSRGRTNLKTQRDFLLKKLNLVASDLLKLDLRETMVTPPYNHFIRLKIGNYQEQVEYSDKKLCQAMKHLNSLLFGGRKLIMVDKLSRWHFGYVIHLPIGFRIRVREVEIRSRRLEQLQSILDDSNLQIVSTPYITNLGHHIYQKSKILVVENAIRNEESWLDFMRTLENKRTVFWAFGKLYFPIDGCIRLVKDWKSNRRAIGTRISFAVINKVCATTFMEKAREEFEVVGEDYGSLTFSMNETDVLNVSYEQAPPEARLSYWFLKLEIILRVN